MINDWSADYSKNYFAPLAKEVGWWRAPIRPVRRLHPYQWLRRPSRYRLPNPIRSLTSDAHLQADFPKTATWFRSSDCIATAMSPAPCKNCIQAAELRRLLNTFRGLWGYKKIYVPIKLGRYVRQGRWRGGRRAIAPPPPSFFGFLPIFKQN